MEILTSVYTCWKRGGGKKELGGLSCGNELGDLVLGPLRCFLKLLLFLASLLGQRLVTQRDGCRSYGEYPQYLEQKFLA